jgi:hypothetical protein
MQKVKRLIQMPQRMRLGFILSLQILQELQVNTVFLLHAGDDVEPVACFQGVVEVEELPWKEGVPALYDLLFDVGVYAADRRELVQAVQKVLGVLRGFVGALLVHVVDRF